MSETTDDHEIELSGETYDLLLAYQHDDEPLADTLDRVLEHVPYPASLPDSVDRGNIDDSTFVLVRNEDATGQLTTVTHESVFDLYKHIHEAMYGPEGDGR